MAVMSDVANARLMRSAMLRRLDWGSIGGRTDFSDIFASNKKAGISAGLVYWRLRNWTRSVSRCDRSAVTAAVTAEAIVDAHGDHIDVLGDPVECTGNDGIGYRERIVCITHEEVIVFNAGRPIRSEGPLPSDAHGTTPAGRACRGQFIAGKRAKYAETIARYRPAALHIEQRRVPSPADLAGEKADAISFRAGREGWIDNTDARVAEVRPIALTFQTKNPLTDLPAITKLATKEPPDRSRQPSEMIGATTPTKSQQLRLWPQPPLAPM